MKERMNVCMSERMNDVMMHFIAFKCCLEPVAVKKIETVSKERKTSSWYTTYSPYVFEWETVVRLAFFLKTSPCVNDMAWGGEFFPPASKDQNRPLDKLPE